MKPSGVGTVEDRGTVHPHADGNRGSAVADAFRETKFLRQGAVSCDAISRETAERTNQHSVDEDLVSVIGIIRHLDS